MGWLDDFFSNLALASPEGRARQSYNINARRQMLLEDEAYRRQREQQQLFPLQLEHQRLSNQGAQATLDDLARQRAEQAQAPGAAQAIVRAFTPTGGTPNDIESYVRGETATPPASPAARTVPELFQRGVTPEQYDIAERYRPATVKGLGLLTPEAAATAADQERVRKRLGEIQQEAEGLDASAPDYRDRGYQIAARGAAVKGDYRAMLEAITKSADPVELLKRLQSELGGPGGLGERQRVQLKAGDTTITYEPDNPTHVVAKKAVEEAGWREGMPGYWGEVLNAIARATVQAGGAVVGAGQLIKPPPSGAAMRPATPAGTAPAAPAPATTGGVTPRYERGVSADTLTDYVDKETLQHPPPGMTQTAIEGSGRYVAVTKAQLPAVRQLATMKTTLDSMDRIVEDRPDLFPRSTGNKAQDALNIAIAKAKFAAGGLSGDADVAQINTFIGTLPMTVRAFGDTGNIAVKEREIAQTAFGLSPNTAEAARTKVDTIRDLINGPNAAAGFPQLKRRAFPKAPEPAGGEGQARLRRANDEATKRYGKAFGQLDEATARALWDELYPGAAGRQ